MTIEDLLEFASTIVRTPAQANRRDRAMERAHAQGKTACEVCGCAATSDSAVRITLACGTVAVLGPKCAAKARKAGLR